MNNSDTDSEEEILVYAEFKDTVNIEKYKNIHVLGIDRKNPIIQLDDTFFTGNYENPLGTCLFFEEDQLPKCADPLFDKLPEKNLKYLYKTTKLLSMEHAYVAPKEGEDSNLQNPLHQAQEIDNIEPVTFNSLQDALDTFKEDKKEHDDRDSKPESNKLPSDMHIVSVTWGKYPLYNAQQHHAVQFETQFIVAACMLKRVLGKRKNLFNKFILEEQDTCEKGKCMLVHSLSLDWFYIFRVIMWRHRRKKKLYLTMEEVFQELHSQCIRLKTRDKKCNNFILHSVLKYIIGKMRACDNLFDSMNPRLDYLGSYYDGLRVGEPTEYDINIVLRIPVNESKIVLDARDSEYGHTSIILPSEFRRLAKTPVTASKGFEKTLLWCDNNHRFSVTKFRSWMQSVVDATLNTFPMENGKKFITVNNSFYFIESRRSGPANTINIIKPNNTIIDVDLVPTFAFSLPKKPIKSSILFTKVSDTNIQQYFVVPKPTQNDFSWRLTFPIQERLLIRSKNNLKSTIRLLKHLRDVQGFKKLSSYYIKTLFLWEIVPEKENMWKNKSLTFLVIYMMKKLRDSLLNGEIKNYWCPDHNLIEKIKKDTCLNWANRLTFIISELEKKGKVNGYVVFEYFKANCKIAAT